MPEPTQVKHLSGAPLQGLREMDIFRSKLVSFILSVPNTLAWRSTEYVHNKLVKCRTQYFISFCGRLIRQSDCHNQSLSTQSKLCVQGKEPTFKVEPQKRLHWGRLHPCLQILSQGCKGIHFQCRPLGLSSSIYKVESYLQKKHSSLPQ